MMCTDTVCGSMECPKYYKCPRARVNNYGGQVVNYYTFGHGTSFTDSNGKQHINEYYACGERGKWRMYEES
jgi:hypothetical protein